MKVGINSVGVVTGSLSYRPSHAARSHAVSLLQSLSDHRREILHSQVPVGSKALLEALQQLKSQLATDG